MAEERMETRKKICVLGAFAVGKSSLVERFVHRAFSDTYLTTVGVRVDKKSMTVDGHSLILLIWDIHGEDAVQTVRESYLRGTAGCLLVADGTRPDTLATAVALKRRVDHATGGVPFALLVNKHDLADDWRVADGELTALRDAGWPIFRTSAKTGEGVEAAFQSLAKALAEALSRRGPEVG